MTNSSTPCVVTVNASRPARGARWLATCARYRRVRLRKRQRRTVICSSRDQRDVIPGGSHEGRRVSRRPQAGAEGVPRSDPGSAGRDLGDQGVRDVRHRSAHLSRAGSAGRGSGGRHQAAGRGDRRARALRRRRGGGRGRQREGAPVGERVMDHHYDGCGTCKHCRAGWTQMCLEGPVVYGSGGHGGHARYMKVPVSTLVPLPDALSFVTGAAISCGTGTAWGALRRLNLQGGETIAIFGQGPVGLSATQLAVVMGARVIAVEIAAERRKLAKQLGAHEVLDPAVGDVVTAIRDLTHGAVSYT